MFQLIGSWPIRKSKKVKEFPKVLLGDISEALDRHFRSEKVEAMDHEEVLLFYSDYHADFKQCLERFTDTDD